MSSENHPEHQPHTPHAPASSPQSPTASTPAQSGAPADGGNPNILSALSEMESQFARLRTLHEESSRKEGALAEQSRRLAEQQSELEAARRAIDQREQQAREQAESAARQRSALDEEKQRLDAEHREAKARLAAEQAEAEKAVAEQLQQQQSKLAKERDATQQTLLQERERLKVEHDKARQELAERQQAEQARLESERKALSDRMRAMEDQTVLLARQAAEAAQRETAVREEEERIAAERAKLNQEAALFDEKSREIRESAEQQITRLNQSWAAKLRSLEDKLNEGESQRAALQHELEVKHDQANQLAEMIEELRAAGNVDPRALAQSEAERQKLIAQLNEHAAAVQHAVQMAESAKAEAQKASELTANAQRAATDELSKREQAILTLKDRLEKALQEKSTLLERVRSAEETASKAKSEAASAVAAAEQAAAEKIAHAESTSSHMSSDATFVGVSPTSTADEALLNEFHHPGWTKRRRERLRRYKGLLQSQARKIVQAQAALQKRHEESEQILSQRAKLSALSKKLSKQEKRLNSSKAKATTLASAMYLTITVTILGGIAWAITQYVHPATYLARAVLEVDPRIEEPGEFELGQWQTFHEELVEDSRFIEAAANRMERRGLSELADPAKLSTRLQKDLYVQSTGDGNITLELRGVGDERTELELDTIVAAYKSVSDAARGTRGDDLPTVVTQPAQADETPVADDRIQWAAGMLGGGGLAIGLLGLLVWSRLVKSKQRMEQMVEIEEALADMDWPDAPGKK